MFEDEKTLSFNSNDINLTNDQMQYMRRFLEDSDCIGNTDGQKPFTTDIFLDLEYLQNQLTNGDGMDFKFTLKTGEKIDSTSFHNFEKWIRVYNNDKGLKLIRKDDIIAIKVLGYVDEQNIN